MSDRMEAIKIHMALPLYGDGLRDDAKWLLAELAQARERIAELESQLRAELEGDNAPKETI